MSEGWGRSLRIVAGCLALWTVLIGCVTPDAAAPRDTTATPETTATPDTTAMAGAAAVAGDEETPPVAETAPVAETLPEAATSDAAESSGAAPAGSDEEAGSLPEDDSATDVRDEPERPVRPPRAPAPAVLPATVADLRNAPVPQVPEPEGHAVEIPRDPLPGVTSTWTPVVSLHLPVPPRSVNRSDPPSLAAEVVVSSPGAVAGASAMEPQSGPTPRSEPTPSADSRTSEDRHNAPGEDNAVHGGSGMPTSRAEVAETVTPVPGDEPVVPGDGFATQGDGLGAFGDGFASRGDRPVVFEERLATREAVAVPVPPTETSEIAPSAPGEVTRPPADDLTARETVAIPAPPPVAPQQPVVTASSRTVDVGETFSVELPGPGWLYLGDSEGVEYRDRRADAEGVTFTFRLLADPGEQALRFEAQDLRTGNLRRHAERVLPASSDAAVVAPASTPGRSGSDLPVARGHAGGVEGGVGVGDAAGLTGEGEAAGSENADGAASGGVQADGEGASERASVERELSLDEVDRLLSTGDRTAAVAILEEMRDGGLGNEDELLFRLAEILESEWEGRDLQRSRSIYQEIVVGFPLSLFRRPSQRRIEYLDRHFFLIR